MAKKMVSIRDKKIQEDRETFDLLCKAQCHPTQEIKTLGLSGGILGLPMVQISCRNKKITD